MILNISKDIQTLEESININKEIANINFRKCIAYSPNTLNPGEVFFGKISMKENGKKFKVTSIFAVTEAKIVGKNRHSKELKLLMYNSNKEYTCNSGAITFITPDNESYKERINNSINNFANDLKNLIIKRTIDIEKFIKNQKEQEERARKLEEIKRIQYDFSKLSPESKLNNLINAGMRNIWMVGPAGCGKSTMARNVAENLNIPYLCISCGVGTSSAEFVGYKYPTRESTKFAEYYAKKSIILIDEMTALDPAVAQVLNSALANGEIETTTGLVKRNPDCIIIATSNTFGSGANRQYVANNQLDSSTIDRFIGGIIEVDYSAEYESQYDEEVVNFVKLIRSFIKEEGIRRIASTRMIQAGHNMKFSAIKDWARMLLVNWSENEVNSLRSFLAAKGYRHEVELLNAA